MDWLRVVGSYRIEITDKRKRANKIKINFLIHSFFVWERKPVISTKKSDCDKILPTYAATINVVCVCVCWKNVLFHLFCLPLFFNSNTSRSSCVSRKNNTQEKKEREREKPESSKRTDWQEIFYCFLRRTSTLSRWDLFSFLSYILCNGLR